MQQIYRRTCRSVISVKLRTNFIEITLLDGCSTINLLHICRTAVFTNTYGELLLQIFIQHACHIFQYKFVSNLDCFLIYFWLVQCSIQNEQSFVFQNIFCSFSDSSMWTVFCKALLSCFFARWCLIRSLSKSCLNCCVAFSFEKRFYIKNSFFFWYLRHCNIESLPGKIFSNIFISIFSPELSNYDPWNSLLVCQFPSYPINKAIVLNNQQLVKFCENNNLRLRGVQKFFKKLHLMWGSCFLNTLQRKGIFKNSCMYELMFKGYLRYKTITSQNVSSEAQVQNFFIS